MKYSDRIEQLRQLGIFSAIMVVIVIAFYFLATFIKKEGQDYQSQYTVQVGKSFIVNVPGKVSIEYRWQINKEKSKGLKLIKVSHIGWVYPKENASDTTTAKTGAPRTAKFYIQAIAPGVVQIAFEYKRRGIAEDLPIRSRDITVHITP
ncbi:MAG: protease inhibitor I42 family protein [Methyloligellaceae bacterium]